MLKTIAIGLVSLLLTGFVAVSYVNAQESTTTPSPSPTTTQTDTPSGAPQTGFGY